MTPNDKIASISEDLCIGCGICVKKCPFDAIQIINLPANLEKETTHRNVMTLQTDLFIIKSSIRVTLTGVYVGSEATYVHYISKATRAIR